MPCRVVELRYAIANDGTDHTLAQLTLAPCDDASPLKVGALGWAAGCWALGWAAVAGWAGLAGLEVGREAGARPKPRQKSPECPGSANWQVRRLLPCE